MKKVKVLIIALIVILASAFFTYVNAEEIPSSKTLKLKFSIRKTIYRCN